MELLLSAGELSAVKPGVCHVSWELSVGLEALLGSGSQVGKFKVSVSML